MTPQGLVKVADPLPVDDVRADPQSPHGIINQYIGDAIAGIFRSPIRG